MAITHVVSTAAVGNANSVTTGNIDTTGAGLLVVMTGVYLPGSTWTLSDNKNNTWTPLTQYTDGAVLNGQLWYASPSSNSTSVGSGHNFTMAGTGMYPALALSAFSGAGGFDTGKENGNGGSGAKVVTGACGTPTQDGSLVITGHANNGAAGTTWSVEPGTFTIAASQEGGGANGDGCAIAYEIQTTATNRDSSWVNNFSAAAAIAVFGPLAGSVVSPPTKVVQFVRTI